MGFGGGKSKGPSVQELQRQQDIAMQKERERIAQETAAKERGERDVALASLDETESRRRAFAGTLNGEGDEAERRKFLKSV